MRHLTLTATVLVTALFTTQASAQRMTKIQMRDIDDLASVLEGHAKELHAEFHEHLENVKHAEKLENDVSAVERIAESLHQFAHNSDGSARSMAQIRRDTNDLLQVSTQITRTLDLAERWVRTRNGRVGIRHMRLEAADVLRIAVRIDGYLPVDTEVIDGQADRLEQAVKELHREFHEHLEGYEVSRHLDEDLEELEGTVEHMHDLAHGKAWNQIDFEHLLRDISEVKQLTTHIESLFVRQSRIGVFSRDYIGIEHSRDAITDVLSSAYLLEHMIRKADPNLGRRPIHNDHLRPRRDRLGYLEHNRHGSDHFEDRFHSRIDDHIDRFSNRFSDRFSDRFNDRLDDLRESHGIDIRSRGFRFE